MANIKCPVTIFHAKNDLVTPMAGAEAILDDAKKSGKSNVKLIKFEEVGPEGKGHIGISKHEDFDEVVLDNTVRYHPDIDYLKHYQKSNKNYMADSKRKVGGENFVYYKRVPIPPSL